MEYFISITSGFGSAHVLADFLRDAGECDSTDKNTSYRKFTGTFTAPAATTAVQNLGNIVFNATYEGVSASKTGAVVKVNKKAVIGDGEPMSYAYYHQVKKGRTPPQAPSYIRQQESDSSC